MRQVLAQPSPGIVVGTRTAVTSVRADGSRGARRVRIVGMDYTAASSSRSRDSRQATADALKVTVSTSATRQGIRLTGAGRAFSKSYNKQQWRHPVRFNPETQTKADVPWVTQGGRPYFGAVLVKRGTQIRSRVFEALDEALAEASARDRTPPVSID